MADSQFLHSGQAAWEPERALDLADRLGVEADVPTALSTAIRSQEPASPAWFGQRLTVLRAMFLVGRPVDEDLLTVWMAEMARLLRDLPLDVLAHSVDEAVKTSGHGFIPSAGEIRAIADPLARERCQHIERLRRMASALVDVQATAARVMRREERRRADAAAQG